MSDFFDRLWEQTLVIRSQGGDEAAFTELVQVYDRRLRYFIGRLVGPEGDFEDILQEVWLDTYRYLPRLRSPKAFRVWLYRITRDKVNLYFRKAYQSEISLADVEIEDECSADPVFLVEETEQIERCLNEITPEHREVLILRFVEDMSYDEIAQMLDCQLGTVRSRIHYAKRALRRVMEEMNHDV